MCESTVYIETENEREEAMIDVVKLTVLEDNIICMDVTGNTKEFPDLMVSVVDSLKHVIELKKKE